VVSSSSNEYVQRPIAAAGKQTISQLLQALMQEPAPLCGADAEVSLVCAASRALLCAVLHSDALDAQVAFTLSAPYHVCYDHKAARRLACFTLQCTLPRHLQQCCFCAGCWSGPQMPCTAGIAAFQHSNMPANRERLTEARACSATTAATRSTQQQLSHTNLRQHSSSSSDAKPCSAPTRELEGAQNATATAPPAKR
jgi:hypothetical protein